MVGEWHLSFLWSQEPVAHPVAHLERTLQSGSLGLPLCQRSFWMQLQVIVSVQGQEGRHRKPETCIPKKAAYKVSIVRSCACARLWNVCVCLCVYTNVSAYESVCACVLERMRVHMNVLTKNVDGWSVYYLWYIRHTISKNNWNENDGS